MQVRRKFILIAHRENEEMRILNYSSFIDRYSKPEVRFKYTFCKQMHLSSASSVRNFFAYRSKEEK